MLGVHEFHKTMVARVVFADGFIMFGVYYASNRHISALLFENYYLAAEHLDKGISRLVPDNIIDEEDVHVLPFSALGDLITGFKTKASRLGVITGVCSPENGNFIATP